MNKKIKKFSMILLLTFFLPLSSCAEPKYVTEEEPDALDLKLQNISNLLGTPYSTLTVEQLESHCLTSSDYYGSFHKLTDGWYDYSITIFYPYIDQSVILDIKGYFDFTSYSYANSHDLIATYTYIDKSLQYKSVNILKNSLCYTKEDSNYTKYQNEYCHDYYYDTFIEFNFPLIANTFTKSNFSLHGDTLSFSTKNNRSEDITLNNISFESLENHLKCTYYYQSFNYNTILNGNEIVPYTDAYELDYYYDDDMYINEINLSYRKYSYRDGIPFPLSVIINLKKIDKIDITIPDDVEISASNNGNHSHLRVFDIISETSIESIPIYYNYFYYAYYNNMLSTDKTGN